MMTHPQCIGRESKSHSLVKSSMSKIQTAVLLESTRNNVLCHDSLHLPNTENLGQRQKHKTYNQTQLNGSCIAGAVSSKES